MESRTIQLLPANEEQIECWDDDDDLQFNEGIQFRAASSAGSVTNSSFRPSGHRDSISSRRSARSDIDSNFEDEDWQVPLHGNDEFAKEEALASAKQAGIPIPTNIPSSALIGGAIKRLSTRKTKRNLVDDWSEDVELPGPDVLLQLRTPQDVTFPEAIRQVNSNVPSPVKSSASPPWNDDISMRLPPTMTNLNRCHESDRQLEPEITAFKETTPRSPQKMMKGLTMRDLPFEQETLDFDQDIEVPPDQQTLQLSHRKDATRMSSPTLDDFDLEWSEGSIGIRVGGTTRDGRSVPSSSISIASPSVSSCLTVESEEDGLDGLVLPDGPLDLTTSLKKREEEISKETRASTEAKAVPKAPKSLEADDFFSGIEVDNGRVFATRRMTLNPNVKCKTEWPASPTRRTATTLTFTTPGADTSASTGSPRQNTRIPRLSGHERTLSTHLETVSESGAPLSKFQRPQSRLGHASQSSVSSLPANGVASSSPISTPSGQRLLGPRASRNLVPAENAPSAPTRILRRKRSLPAVRNSTTTATTSLSSQRTPPHPDGYIRPSATRPRTPAERPNITDMRTSGHRAQASFLPGVTSDRHQHQNIKTFRPSRRHNSDGSGDLLSPQRASLPSRSTRPQSHRLSLDDSKTTNSSPSATRTLTRPTKRRNFGDGSELESFDDLPTSFSAESKFTKNPTGRGAPRSMHARLSQSRVTPTGQSPTPLNTPPSTSKQSNTTPRFARDTNASRNAREQRIASINSRNRDAASLGSLASNWKANPISRISPNAAPVRGRKNKPSTKSQSKPHLIKPMGVGVQEPKLIKGMRYNPSTFLWEGNENLAQEFDVATVPRSPKPAPALISNVGTASNVQTVGGMVFDPQRMCWLRATSREPGKTGKAPSEDEDDVFAGLADLEDGNSLDTGKPGLELPDDSHPPLNGDDPSAGESSDEGPMTEEFDVGPEFIRRQRAEEEKWRRKVDKWVGFDRRSRDTHWQWAIRDLVTADMGNPPT